MRCKARSTVIHLALASLILLLALPTLGAQESKKADQASEAFNKGLKLLEAQKDSSLGNQVEGQESPKEAEARQAFVNVAQLWEDLAYEAWQYHYKAGTAWWWAGDYTKSIIHFRSYLLKAPFDTKAWENLRSAREKNENTDPGNESFLDWPWTVWFLYAALGALSMALFLLGLFSLLRKPGLRKAFLSFGLLAFLFGLGLGISFCLKPQVAVLLEDTQGYKGNSSVYEPSSDQVWKAGQELRIHQKEESWYNVSVGSNTFWVPESSVFLIE